MGEGGAFTPHEEAPWGLAAPLTPTNREAHAVATAEPCLHPASAEPGSFYLMQLLPALLLFPHLPSSLLTLLIIIRKKSRVHN